MRVATLFLAGFSAMTALLLPSEVSAFQASTIISSPQISNSALEAATATGTDASTVAVLVCPAQFCVPDDYNVLFDNLSQELADKTDSPQLGTCMVAPLPRTEWIKVARQLPTRNFWDATLPVHKTLGWYFDAIETAMADILAKEGPNVKICIIGHSIGGWVARAYLGGLSRCVLQENFLCFRSLLASSFLTQSFFRLFCFLDLPLQSLKWHKIELLH